MSHKLRKKETHVLCNMQSQPGMHSVDSCERGRGVARRKENMQGWHKMTRKDRIQANGTQFMKKRLQKNWFSSLNSATFHLTDL